MESGFKWKITSVFRLVIPPKQWRFPVIILLGVACGLFIQIVITSRAHSYLSDNPETCINCHVMAPYYATYKHGSHARVATCNDCHVPQDNIFEKYLFKASDGARHATMFTLRLEPQVIRIKEAGAEAVQKNCERCHNDLLHPIALRSMERTSTLAGGERQCWDCHREVPHGRVNSLTSTPNALVPLPGSAVPELIKPNRNTK